MRSAWIALALALLLLTGCKTISRQKIQAATWLNNGFDPELCGASQATSKNPHLWDYGFYRRLNDGKLEFMSYCDPRATHWLSMYDVDYNKLLDAATPGGG